MIQFLSRKPRHASSSSSVATTTTTVASAVDLLFLLVSTQVRKMRITTCTQQCIKQWWPGDSNATDIKNTLVEFCCAYGSTLLHACPDGTYMVDYILGVADPLHWHTEEG
ncbi:phosphatidate cytidylyltransferase, mitochondrial [Hordeum vulgare]|nr:phosphatidate cytidylyltransferase, mitochondrial [Hordeum vulgare]